MAWLNRSVILEELARRSLPSLIEGLNEKITDAQVAKLVPVESTQAFTEPKV